MVTICLHTPTQHSHLPQVTQLSHPVVVDNIPPTAPVAQVQRRVLEVLGAAHGGVLQRLLLLLLLGVALGVLVWMGLGVGGVQVLGERGQALGLGLLLLEVVVVVAGEGVAGAVLLLARDGVSRLGRVLLGVPLLLVVLVLFGAELLLDEGRQQLGATEAGRGRGQAVHTSLHLQLLEEEREG